MAQRKTVLDTIGATPLLELQSIRPAAGGRICLKLEDRNPTGSMKDRMALAMIEGAEREGRLIPGGTVVEYTGGSTGVSLALVCAVKGYKLHVVTSDAFAQEKLDHMRLLGARLEVIPSGGGRMTERLTRDMIARAGEIAQATGGYWTDQMNNTHQLDAYHRLADEIWGQTAGGVTVFVQSVGTAACIRGTGERLRALKRDVRVVAVEPAESAVLSARPSGAHRIDGIGAGYVVPLWEPHVADDIETVSTEEAREMAFRLAREEGSFCGMSTGANVVAALRVAERLQVAGDIVTLMCDTGMKYLRGYGAAMSGRHGGG